MLITLLKLTVKIERTFKMADTKYTLIGMTSAGKTCYITAMYMKMAAGFDGFTLVTDDQTRAKLERDILALRVPNGVERFPVATDETTTRSYDFKLNYNTQKIITFEMLDYAGGLLRTKESSYAQVKESIAQSTVLYIFIDGKSFCSNDIEERKENVYYDCAMTVTPIIQDFADTHKGKLPPIVFVITKADLCKNFVTGDEITKVIKDLFSPAFSDNTSTYICAVSLGDSISDDNYKGKLKPVNIHIPFFIGSYHEFYDRCVLLKNEIKVGNSKLMTEMREFKLDAHNEIKKIKWFRDEYYIKSCLARAKDASDAYKSNQDVLNNTTELLSIFGERLESESSNFKYFISGVEQSSFKSFKI